MTTTAAPTIVTDAKALGQASLGAIRTAIDTAFGKAEEAVPQLTGDVALWANTWIDGHVATPTTRTYLKGALGIAASFEGELDTLAVAGLVDLDHAIDARIDAFMGA